jgi:hypothetical protein
MKQLSTPDLAAPVFDAAAVVEREMRSLVEDPDSPYRRNDQWRVVWDCEPVPYSTPDNVTVTLTKHGLHVSAGGHRVMTIVGGGLTGYNPGPWERVVENLASRLVVARDDYEGLQSAVRRINKLAGELDVVRRWCDASDVPAIEDLCRRAERSNATLEDRVGFERFLLAVNGGFRTARLEAESCLHDIEQTLRQYGRNADAVS